MLGPFCIWFIYSFSPHLSSSHPYFQVSPSISSLAPHLFPLSHFFLPLSNLSFSFLSLFYPSPVTFILSFLTFPLFLACSVSLLPFLSSHPSPSLLSSSSPPPSSLLPLSPLPASHTSSHLKFYILWDQILTSLRCSAKEEINFAYSNWFDVIDKEFSRWHRNTLSIK